MNFACKHCFFARPNQNQPGTLLCHANPPIPMQMTQATIANPQGQTGIAMIVPVVGMDYFCRLFAQQAVPGVEGVQ